ncbi:MAG: hypothetical protein LBT51_08330 [Fusobacteriaceae bacterium]|jgi:hypothetical protein|nr:hypothetical protein [Fusobacteriaceae bacterium]
MINRNTKIGIFVLLFFILFGILFSFIIYADYYFMKNIDPDYYEINSNKLNFVIDSIDNKSKTIDIVGWAVKKEQDLKTVETYIVLKNIKTELYYKIGTIKRGRKDVTEHFKKYFSNIYNYDNCGFFAKVSKTHLRSKGREKYEIYILYLSDGNKILQGTSKFIEKENL